MTKVKHILENDVTDMELTFTEEVYEKGALVNVSSFHDFFAILLLNMCVFQKVIMLNSSKLKLLIDRNSNLPWLGSSYKKLC